MTKRIFIGSENGPSRIEENQSRDTSKAQESEPRLNFRILYSAHDSETNFWSREELEKELQNTDIWFPENVGWTDDAEKILKTFAAGKYKVPENIEPVLKTQLETLQKVVMSGKEIAVGFVDLPEGHPLLKLSNVDPGSAIKNFLSGQFEEAVVEIQIFAKKIATFQRAREEYMQRQMELEIENILRDNPRLREKLNKQGKLDVLMTLGTLHTGVSHNLKKEGYGVDRRFNHKLPFTFSPNHELIRRFRFKKETSDQLAAQVLLYIVIMPELAFLNDEKADQVANKIVRTVSLNDIKSISLKFQSNLGIRNIATQMNIVIPSSEREADELLSK